ncbi:hypothetical protein JCM11641_006639 [Rhodosporidiobolus odoratus]
MTGFFPQPLDYTVQATGIPAAPSSSSSTRDSPSPNKKRRLDATASEADAGAGKPKSSASSASSRSQRVTEEEALLTSRLHSTLRLRDAWADILRRHSQPPPAPSSASSPFAGPSSLSTSSSAHKSRRHNPAGWTRALPVEEDDIIDLGTLEIVQDRGVLRSSRAGAFAIGGYAGTFDDVIVGRDSGTQDGGPEGEDGGEEEEDEVDWEEAGDGALSSDDELATIDDLPSLPSLLFREERRKEDERRRELEEFRAQEARSRGVTAALDDEIEIVLGNQRLRKAVSTRDNMNDLDELSFCEQVEAGNRFSSPTSRRKPTTPSHLSRPSECPAPQSTTQTLRRAVQDISLAASPSSSSSSMLAPSPSKPPSKRSAARIDTQNASSQALVTPWNSFAAPKVSSPSPCNQARSKPRSSSSPLKNVIVIPSRSPSPELGLLPPLSSRQISPELGIFPVPSTSSAICQHPTPTPTPPPSSRPTPPRSTSASARKKRQHHSFDLTIDVPVFRPPHSRRSPFSAHARSQSATSSPPVPPEPPRRKPRPRPPVVKKKDLEGLQRSRFMPALAAIVPSSSTTIAQSQLPERGGTSKSSSAVREKRKKQEVEERDNRSEVSDSLAAEGDIMVERESREKLVGQVAEPEKEVEDDEPVFDTGLSTPPLSRGSRPRVNPLASSAAPSSSTMTPRRALSKADDDDPLLLSSSPVKPSPIARAARPPRFLVDTPSIFSLADSGTSKREAKRRMSMSLIEDGSDSEDELLLA